MKKQMITMFLALLLSLSLIGSISAVSDEKMHYEPVPDDVVIAFEAETEIFTQMLDSNFIYNEAFVSDSLLIEGSMLSLLPEAIEGRLHKDRISEFMLDFYGVTMNPAAYNQSYVAGEYFYYIPKGYDKASHTIISIDYDGEYYTVVSNVVFSTHDLTHAPHKVVSTFVANKESEFGYNLINCILE